jgi:hypothetical protein
VARLNGNDVYFEPGVYGRLEKEPRLLNRVVAALAAVPGVARVFRSAQVRVGARSRDPLLRAASLGYYPGRSGDLIIVPKPGWIFYSGGGTTHGTASPADQRVPLVLWGRGIKPGRYPEAATPADIAPTLSAMFGFTMPSAEGRVLESALVSVPAARGAVLAPASTSPVLE